MRCCASFGRRVACRAGRSRRRGARSRRARRPGRQHGRLAPDQPVDPGRTRSPGRPPPAPRGPSVRGPGRHGRGERCGLYEQVATAIVDTDDLVPEAVADIVVELLAERPGGRLTKEQEDFMLRPQDNSHARDQAARRHLELHARRCRHGPCRGLVASDAARRPADARAEQLQRRARRSGRARPRRRRVVPTHRLRSPRLGRAANRPAVRRGHAPGGGLGRRHLRRRARGRLHALRGRRHRLSSRRARSSASPWSSTTSSRGSPSRRASWR